MKDYIFKFKISRGGRFFNGGHISLVGQEKIGEGNSLNDLFPIYDGLSMFVERLSNGLVIPKYADVISSLLSDEQALFDFVRENEDELANYFYLGVLTYYDESNNLVGLTEKDVESGIGRINRDGIYDTVYTSYLSDLNEEELTLLKESSIGSFYDQEIKHFHHV